MPIYFPSVYAITSDNVASNVVTYKVYICRSVELRYQYDNEVLGITAARFSANEWFLDNDDGCFCINATTGINEENGCLLRGAMEMQTCVGKFCLVPLKMLQH